MLNPLILASTSKYRLSLFARLGLPFTAVDPNVVEADWHRRSFSPQQLVESLAFEKAKRVAADHPESVVIGGDQVAAIGHQILGKPGSFERSLEQLRFLSGKTHELMTAVVIVGMGQTLSHTDTTRLTMDNLAEDALRRYLEQDQPFDCAGSYKIERLGISLFTAIEGSDVTAIQGLPLMAVARLLRGLGYQIP